MMAELRQKSQITIPKEIVLKLGLNEGDKVVIAGASRLVDGTMVKVIN